MRDKTKYNAYINSPEWQLKRKEVFEEKGYKCEACGKEEYLHVHHGTYRRLYNEKISDLFVLCGTCHMDLHDKYGTKDLLRATKAYIKGEELVPRKKRSKSRGKKRKVKAISNVIIYGKFHLYRMLTITRVAMVSSRRFNEKRYKRYVDRMNKQKHIKITTTIF